MLNSYFKGLNVVELASVLAGPLVGSFLSELGSNVTKIENKRSNGDITRQWKNSKESKEATETSYYASANYNKQSVFLDFNDPSDYSKLKILISKADIVISNFQKRVGEKYKLDPISISNDYPKIIFIQLNAYTYEDPRPGFDMVMQAETGYLSMCGNEDGAIAKIPVAMMDILASHQMKEGMLISMIHKLTTGKGSVVQVSLYKAAISALVNQATNYLNQGLIARPIGTKHPNIAPYGDILTTADGERLIIAIGSDAQFATLMDALNIESSKWLKFALNATRVLYRSDLIELLNLYSNKIGFKKLAALLSNKGIPYGEIKDLNQVFDEKLAKDMVVQTGGNLLSISNIAFDIHHL